MSILINTWEDFKNIANESETHILVLKEYSAWLKAKNEKPYNSNIDYMSQVKNLNVYLSTHTFYESMYKHSTEILQLCGFDVQLSSWG